MKLKKTLMTILGLAFAFTAFGCNEETATDKKPVLNANNYDKYGQAQSFDGGVVQYVSTDNIYTVEVTDYANICLKLTTYISASTLMTNHIVYNNLTQTIPSGSYMRAQIGVKGAELYTNNYGNIDEKYLSKTEYDSFYIFKIWFEDSNGKIIEAYDDIVNIYIERASDFSPASVIAINSNDDEAIELTNLAPSISLGFNDYYSIAIKNYSPAYCALID